jgi:hypothetical protein
LVVNPDLGQLKVVEAVFLLETVKKLRRQPQQLQRDG